MTNSKPQGYSLHIGLNKVDPAQYNTIAQLQAAVSDAEYMHQLATNNGYTEPVLLPDEQATSTAVLNLLDEFAQKLQPGDILLITYSGHGGQMDLPEYYTPNDFGPDETWCLYDRQLIDDELFEAFLKFKEGVRILVISDSCHSGTVIRAIDDDADLIEKTITAALEELEKTGAARKKLYEKGFTSDEQFNSVYKPILDKLKKNDSGDRRVLASVKLFAAAQDNQVAYDGDDHGRFTASLKGLIDKEIIEEKTSSAKLIELLKNQFKYPVPNLLDYGAIIPSFDTYLPFIINIPNPTETAGYRMPPRDESVPIAWRNIQFQDAPPAPEANILSVSVTLTDPAEKSLQECMSVLPDGVKSVRITGKNRILVEFDPKIFHKVWDAIHAILQRADQLKIPVEAEPAQTVPAPVAEEAPAAKNGGESYDYLPKWPPVSNGAMASFAWHLDSKYSQLADARNHVMEGLENKTITQKVRIAHFDTGYFPSHPAIWNNPNILRDKAKSFIPGEITNPGIDVFYNSNGENQGHGLGTLALLAGWQLSPDQTDGVFSGYFGAAPCAEVIPMRIGDSVIIFDGNTFVDAVDYAIEQQCEVITMSRGGKPSLGMARAVNKAYEAGIVIVTAAGNSVVGGPGFEKYGPRTVVWPARFPRVIAACGVCQNQFPYDFEAQEKFGKQKDLDNVLDRMQGNWGPASAMNYALAAYTPNVPWALYRKERYFSLDGGGTSSATPQIAAAAALYIMKHRDDLIKKGYYNEGSKWKKVEAVRQALFQGALKPVFPDGNDYKTYYGNGILQAMNSLSIGVVDITDDMRAPKAESSLFGWSEAIGLLLNRRRSVHAANEAFRQAAALEICHVLMSDPALANLHDSLPYGESKIDDNILEEVIAAVKTSDYCSEVLKAEL